MTLSHPTAGLLLATIVALNATCAASAADADPPRRSTISVRADGKEVAGLVLLPGQGVRQVSVDAVTREPMPGGGLHASGHVQVTLILENAAPLTIFGDDLVLHSDPLDTEEMRALDDLRKMRGTDQSIRALPTVLTKADWARQEAIDAVNMRRLAEIVARYGWPGMRFAGVYASTSWAVLQHADVASQRTYLPLVRAAAARGDVQPSELAMLEDRVLANEGKPQLYGSQLTNDRPPQVKPVTDPAHLDDRRRAVGLGPEAEYLEMARQADAAKK